MRRIIVVGPPRWSDRRTTTAALKQVMEVYRGPYTLVYDMRDGAVRYAAAAARTLGWDLEPHDSDGAKCAPECPPDHRRIGGPEGTYCPTARRRQLTQLLDTSPDLLIAYTHPGAHDNAERAGQAEAKKQGIAVWSYEHKKGAIDNGNQVV